MEKKYQVFVSSTYTDLKEERQAVVEQVLKQGHIPAGMELFRADDRSQKEIIKKWIEESDIYVLILGYRYGTIDEESGISYTEWEYELAGELNKPRIVITLSDDWLKEKLVDADLRANEIVLPRYTKFRNKLKNSGRYAHEATSLSGLRLKITENLSYVIEMNLNHLVGWISANYVKEGNGGLKVTEQSNLLSDSVFKELSELISSDDSETIVSEGMKFCYQVFNDFYIKMQGNIESSHFDLNTDGRSPMESFTLYIARNQVDVTADYYRNSIKIISFIQSLGGTASSVIAEYVLNQDGVFVDEMRSFDNKLTEKNIEEKIKLFITSANNHKKLKNDF